MSSWQSFQSKYRLCQSRCCSREWSGWLLVHTAYLHDWLVEQFSGSVQTCKQVRTLNGSLLISMKAHGFQVSKADWSLWFQIFLNWPLELRSRTCRWLQSLIPESWLKRSAELRLIRTRSQLFLVWLKLLNVVLAWKSLLYELDDWFDMTSRSPWGTSTWMLSAWRLDRVYLSCKSCHWCERVLTSSTLHVWLFCSRTVELVELDELLVLTALSLNVSHLLEVGLEQLVDFGTLSPAVLLEIKEAF